jgi:hypothetical protein
VPLIPFPNYQPDIVDYQSNASLTISGVVPRADGYGPVPSPTVYTSALPGQCRGAFVAWKSDGTVAIFAATSTRIYLLNNTTLAWGEVSKGWVSVGSPGPGYTALAGTDQWQFAKFGNIVIAVQANTVPQAYDLGAGGVFADLGGSPPQAKYISIVGRFVVLSGLTGTTLGPYTVQWSGLNAITTWAPPLAATNSADSQVLPDGGVVRGVAGGESGLIFQDSAIRKMTYTQDTTLVFQIERISQDIGLYAPYSLTRAGQVTFFVSPQGLNRVAPGEFPVEIGKGKFNRTLMADLDRGDLYLTIGASDPRQSRLLLAYNSIGNSDSTRFDKLLCYDFLLDKATIIPLQGEYIFTTAQPGLTMDGLDSIFTPSGIDTLPPPVTSFDAITNALTPELAMFDTSHRLCFFRGTPLEATLDTAEQGTDGQRLRVRGFRPITDAVGAFGSLVSRETVQATPTTTAETIVNAIGMCPQNKSARYARGRLRIPAGINWTYAIGVEPDFSLEGSR